VRGLQAKRVLITGGASGIGAATAARFLDEGCVVCVIDRDADARRKIMEELPDLAGAIAADVSDLKQVQAAFAETIRLMLGVDVLINNAGITADRTVAKMGDEEWQKVIDVNLSGAFYVSQAAMAHMLERGTGRIIDISSVIGETGNIGQANYAASKSGLFGLTKSLALEAAFQLKRTGKLDDGVGLTVNTVAPGFIATDMLATVPEKVLDSIRAQVPLGRLGRPDEIARAVCFLAADESGYITGQTFAVNGGLDM